MEWIDGYLAQLLSPIRALSKEGPSICVDGRVSGGERDQEGNKQGCYHDWQGLLVWREAMVVGQLVSM